MKKEDILYNVCACAMGAAVLVGHIALFYWLFGRTATVVYSIVQTVFAVWMVYEVIRAPVIDD